MTNPIIRSHFLAQVRAAIAKAEYVSGVSHAGLRGKFREIFAADLLRPILPPGFGVGTGKIIDFKGGQSAECDLIIYNRLILPPTLFDASSGLFPIEACIYAIEIKSVVTLSEWKDTITKFQQASALQPMKEGDYRPRTVLFGFGSDLSKKTELERYIELDPQPYRNKDPACMVHCIVGRGYSYWDAASSVFKTLPREEEYEEVVDLLGGIANSLLRYTEHRKGLPFGLYIIRERP